MDLMASAFTVFLSYSQRRILWPPLDPISCVFCAFGSSFYGFPGSSRDPYEFVLSKLPACSFTINNTRHEKVHSWFVGQHWSCYLQFGFHIPPVLSQSPTKHVSIFDLSSSHNDFQTHMRPANLRPSDSANRRPIDRPRFNSTWVVFVLKRFSGST